MRHKLRPGSGAALLLHIPRRRRGLHGTAVLPLEQGRLVMEGGGSNDGGKGEEC